MLGQLGDMFKEFDRIAKESQSKQNQANPADSGSKPSEGTN